MRRLILGLTLLLATGCGGDPLVGIKGKVSFEGKALDTGVITFRLSGVAENPPTYSTVITNGQYEIPKEQGLPPGTYIVSVTSPDGKTPSADPNALPGPSGNFSSKDRIPKKYNLESKVEVVVETKPNPKIYDLNVE